MTPVPALLALLAAGQALAAPPWQDCLAEPDRNQVLLACPDSACTVAETRNDPPAAISAFEEMIRRAGSRAVLGPGSGRGVLRGRAEGEPDVLVAADTVRPGVTRLVSCVLAGADPTTTRAAAEARFSELRAHGLPPLGDLLPRWAVPSFGGGPMEVPAGCVPTVDRAGGRVACGMDQVTVAVLPGAGSAEEVLAAAGARLDDLARARGVRLQTRRRACTVAGVPTTCRQDVIATGDPLETPNQIAGAYDREGAVHLARCAWAGDAETPPPVCLAVIRPVR